MLLIVSHYTKNKGTTDYYIDYLKSKKTNFYYLRHPFNFDKDSTYSELVYFDNNEEKVLFQYKKIGNSILDLLRNYFLSLFISLKLGGKVKKVLVFGSFNFVPFTIFNFILKRNLYFWGVDYSRKRFGNKLMNSLYHYFENVACKKSTKVISSSVRQEEARMKYHNLDKNKSLVISNGINETDFKKDFFEFNETALLYIGSITPQHGIIDFIKSVYLDQNFDKKMFVFGAGESFDNLKKLLKDNKLGKKIKLYGSLPKNEMEKELLKINYKLIAVAPYSDKVNDHVYYIDSLKVKEYLNYGMIFLASDIFYIPEELQKFGLVVNNFNNFNNLIEKVEKKYRNIKSAKKYMNAYLWKNLFKNIEL